MLKMCELSEESDEMEMLQPKSSVHDDTKYENQKSSESSLREDNKSEK